MPFRLSCGALLSAIIVWQKARALAVHVYHSTEQLPKVEIYGLTAQIRRAVISIVSNIAEGQGRLTTGEFLHFLGQARGSLLEVDAQLLIASDLMYLKPTEYENLSQEIYQVLGLLNRLIDRCRESTPQAFPLCNLETPQL